MKTEPMKMPMILKEYELWIGNYHLGQGSDPPSKSQMIAKVTAPSFAIACLKYELKSMLSSIEAREKSGEYIDQQSCRWFYEYDTNSNSWTGRYFETEKEAAYTFTNEYREWCNKEIERQLGIKS